MRDEIFSVLVKLLVLITAIPTHEAAHAFAAHKLGDDTAKAMGRMTLNPLVHFDLWGSLCMLIFGVGWAKSVPVDFSRLHHPRQDSALVAAAGPLSNFLMAFLAVILAKVCYYLPWASVTDTLYIIFINICLMNISLAVFNLLPFQPFDGGRILGSLLPTRLYGALFKWERYILGGVLILLWLGIFDAPMGFARTGALWLMDRGTFWIDKIGMAFWTA